MKDGLGFWSNLLGLLDKIRYLLYYINSCKILLAVCAQPGLSFEEQTDAIGKNKMLCRRLHGDGSRALVAGSGREQLRGGRHVLAH